MVKNIAASIRHRLLNQSRKTDDETFNNLAERYLRERFLYRLSQSKKADDYILKGATVFQVWLGKPHRPTRDIDLLNTKLKTEAELKKEFTNICAIECNDGIEFTNIEASPIQANQKYAGTRLDIKAKLDTIRLKLQIDVAYGQLILPPAKIYSVDSLLDQPPARLKIYPKETVIAEKLHAIVERGLDNSRIKDYFDLLYLSERESFDGQLLAAAIKTSFSQRKTSLPSKTPIGLTKEYIDYEPDREKQWQKFWVKENNPPTLMQAIGKIEQFTTPLLIENQTFAKQWSNGQWQRENRFKKELEEQPNSQPKNSPKSDKKRDISRD